MDITYIPSPNFHRGRQNYKPIAIVIHIMQGTLAGTGSWFSDPFSQVSAHYGIGKNGNIHRYVMETNGAWHAGRVVDPDWKHLIKAGNGNVVDPNLYTIGIEHEGTADSEWTSEMYASSSALIADISRRWDIPLDRDHIIGHHQIYAVKTCPGNKVNFDQLIEMARKIQGNPVSTSYQVSADAGSLLTICDLNIRKEPNRLLAPVRTLEAGSVIEFTAFTLNGESISTNSKWYKDHDGNWFWAGGVIAVNHNIDTPPVEAGVPV